MTEAVNAVYQDVVEAVAEFMPHQRVEINRVTSKEYPRIWMYSSDTAPTGNSWEVSELLFIHIWSTSFGEATEVEKALRFLHGHRIARFGEARALRYGRPNVTRVIEQEHPYPWHVQVIVPVLMLDRSVVSQT